MIQEYRDAGNPITKQAWLSRGKLIAVRLKLVPQFLKSFYLLSLFVVPPRLVSADDEPEKTNDDNIDPRAPRGPSLLCSHNGSDE
jgi:hypothetical protein